jgi:hypothetical protein
MGNIRIFGRKLRTGVLVFVLVAVGMGAAAPSLSGLVQGEFQLGVSQAIIVGEPIIKTPVDSWFSSVADDHTGFTAAAQVNTGDYYVFTVPIGNSSENDLIGELTLQVPSGLGVGVQEKAGSYVRNVTSAGPLKWRFHVKSQATLGTEAVHPALIVKIEALEEKLNVLKGLIDPDDFLLTMVDIKLGLWALGAELDWFGLDDLLNMAEIVMEKALILEGMTPGDPATLAFIDGMIADLAAMKSELPPGISGIDILVKVADNVVGYGSILGTIKQVDK